MQRARALGLSLLLATSATTLSQPARAEAAPSMAGDRKLPELPTPPSIELGRPQATDLAEVDALLGRIR